MERLANCHQLLDALQHRARAQADPLKTLENAFSREAAHLRRLDQAQCLDVLRARVAREIAAIHQKEAIESSAFTKATLVSGLVRFGVGSLMGLLLRREEHPLSVGARLAEYDFTPMEPFGTVMVAIAARGVPDDVQVVPISRYARGQRVSESTIVARFKARGYRLMIPRTFFKALDELKEHVLQGVVTLPVGTGSFLLKPC